MGKCTALRMKHLVEPGPYADGDCLFLKITNSVTTSWIPVDTISK